jgi:hypothetical protein
MGTCKLRVREWERERVGEGERKKNNQSSPYKIFSEKAS